MKNTEVYVKLRRCLETVRKKTSFTPYVALVLGSGLGGLADVMQVECTVEYSEIDGFPVSTVDGHAGRFLFGYLEGVPVVCMQGRVHYYEGYDISDVVLPVRLMSMLGAKMLFLTNAAGGINRDFDAGDLMIIKDHILSFFPANPLVGANIDELGGRFSDMSEVYDRKFCDIIADCAANLGIKIHRGVYVQLTGPSYETPAEIRMLGNCGADAVGMSTACEAVAARHCGMKICGVSCITNKAAGISETPLTHDEVKAAADKAAESFRALVKDSLRRLYESEKKVL